MQTPREEQCDLQQALGHHLHPVDAKQWLLLLLQLYWHCWHQLLKPWFCTLMTKILLNSNNKMVWQVCGCYDSGVGLLVPNETVAVLAARLCQQWTAGLHDGCSEFLKSLM